MITGEGAQRVLDAIKALDPVSPDTAIALIEADLMGVKVHALCVAQHAPMGEGVVVGFEPIAILASPEIAKRLRIGGESAETVSMPIVTGYTGTA